VRVSADLQANPILDGTTVAALKEILVNLVLNAAQAMSGQEADTQIQIASREPLIISVTDSGVGIPPTLQSKIFEPFFTTKQRGTGLGLAIVARRVREIGGNLSVTSPVNDGRGTRFELVLKLDRSE
jgi:signal transduction histidine kinase